MVLHAGRIELSELIAFVGLMALFRNPSNKATTVFSQLRNGVAGARRILALLTASTELDQNTGGHEAAMRGEIAFERASFGYHRGQTVLADVDLHIAAGETVALVGQTGSAKTTLTQLVNRTYDPGAGRIAIDGVDLRDWNLTSLRSQIATIEQDVFLFSLSIADNIAFARPGARRQDLEAAARAAAAHDFIESFTDGYDTIIGERGVTLSGGQRQRIALARAYLKDPRILILDDSTSAIDSATEDEIQRALYTVQRGTHHAAHHPPAVADPLGRPRAGARPRPGGGQRPARRAAGHLGGLPPHLQPLRDRPAAVARPAVRRGNAHGRRPRRRRNRGGVVVRSPYDGLSAEGYDRRYRDRELVGRILGFFRAERRAMLMVSTAIVAGSLIGAALPIVLSRTIDQVATAGFSLGAVAVAVAAILLLSLSDWGFSALDRTVAARAVSNVVLRLRRAVFDAVLPPRPLVLRPLPYRRHRQPRAVRHAGVLRSRDHDHPGGERGRPDRADLRLPVHHRRAADAGCAAPGAGDLLRGARIQAPLPPRGDPVAPLGGRRQRSRTRDHERDRGGQVVSQGAASV